MPSNSGGAWTPISSVITAPQFAALRHEFRVPEALHQHDPGTRNVGGIPAQSCVFGEPSAIDFIQG